jgi:hypothetical protein
MHTDPVRLQPLGSSCRTINRRRFPDIDSELVLPQTRRDVRMRIRKNIRIHPQSKPRLHLPLPRPRGQQLQLRLALDIELKDVCAKSAIYLVGRFSYSREHHASRGIRRSGKHPRQFPTRHNIETRAMLRQQLQNRQRRVRLDRISDQVFPPCKRTLKQPNSLHNLMGRIHVEGRTILLRQRLQRNAVAMERPARTSRAKGSR